MKNPLNRFLELGSAPLVLAATIIVLVTAALAGPLTGSKFISADTRNELFEGAMLATALEILLLGIRIMRRVTSIERHVLAAEDEFSLVPPPHVRDETLREFLEKAGGGSLKIICYGTNKYGGVLSTIQQRFHTIKTEVVVCPPESALTHADADSIREVITDISRAPHIKVTAGNVLPTIRAALLRRPDNTPIWVSVAPYLIHKQNRGMVSASVSPVMTSNVPGSHPMTILAEFVDAEFARLTAGRAPVMPTKVRGHAGPTQATTEA